MKKVVFGCLGLAVVLFIAGGIGAYYFIYRPAKAYLAEFTRLKELPQLNAQVTNQTSFSAPANHELTSEQVTRFVGVQQAIRAQLGPRIDELDAKYKAFEREFESEGKQPGFTHGLAALKDLINLILEAKRAQIAALNTANLSVAEYDWTRRTVYAASGIPLDFTIEQAIRDVARGEVPDFDKGTTTEDIPVPDKNRELVQPHLEQLTKNAGLAFFGL